MECLYTSPPFCRITFLVSRFLCLSLLLLHLKYKEERRAIHLEERKWVVGVSLFFFLLFFRLLLGLLYIQRAEERPRGETALSLNSSVLRT